MRQCVQQGVRHEAVCATVCATVCVQCVRQSVGVHGMHSTASCSTTRRQHHNLCSTSITLSAAQASHCAAQASLFSASITLCSTCITLRSSQALAWASVGLAQPPHIRSLDQLPHIRPSLGLDQQGTATHPAWHPPPRPVAPPPKGMLPLLRADTLMSTRHCNAAMSTHHWNTAMTTRHCNARGSTSKLPASAPAPLTRLGARL